MYSETYDNPRISAVWSTTKPIAAFSCTPRVPVVLRSYTLPLVS